MPEEIRRRLEDLAVSLEAELSLCQTREHHIRAAANANAARLILAHYAAATAQPPAA